MRFPNLVRLFAAFLAVPPLAGLPTSGPVRADAPLAWERVQETVRPLAPDFRIARSGAVTLRVCYNWSCARTERMTFSADEMAGVVRQLEICPGDTLQQRLQRLRIGIWQMELLAAQHQPLLRNDQAINSTDRDLEGRTDCIDNASNSTNFLAILLELGVLDGWSLEPPSIRDRFSLATVHWTAVVVDRASGTPWSVDSWYRPHGHLPFVMPLDAWLAGETGWERPLLVFNPTPRDSSDLCPDALPRDTVRDAPSAPVW
jgi:hypothetical protein